VHPTVCDTLLDVVQNSFEAGATRVDLSVARTGTMLACSVADNGRGMDEDTRRRALDPFYTDGKKHPSRKVGLGLPFLEEMTRASGGAFSLDSAPGRGTTVSFSFDLANVDAPSFGDAAGTFTSLMTYPGNHVLALSRRDGENAYSVTSSDLADALGDLSEAGNLAMLKEFFRSNEEALSPDAVAPFARPLLN